MSRYDVDVGPDSPTNTTRSRRSSLHSIASRRFNPRRQSSIAMPDPGEMDAAFDAPTADDGEDEGETHGLLSSSQHRGGVPGDYDFERDYTLPPESPPPFQPYSSHHPAPGNSHGIVPTTAPARPIPARHFLGGILPTSFLPRQQEAGSSQRTVGGGMSGVFDNLAARPDRERAAEGELDYIPEDESKDAPPSYQNALRDAVPPYWDTTVVLPSSNSPFGPLSSSVSVVVSVSFQFVGFLLTYVLHTTHAAKYGSRAGLGLTLIQVGLNIRAKAVELIDQNRFPAPVSDDPSDPPSGGQSLSDEEIAENAIEAIWGPGASPWPAVFREPNAPEGSPGTIVHNTHEAEQWAMAHNRTLTQMLDLPSAADVGKANEYFSFLLMSVGWFIVLTSVGGWWRVKRFERGLRRAQRESEEAQAEAAAGRGEGAEGENNLETVTTSTSPREPSPNELAYYTAPFTQAFSGARHIRDGFLGLHGSRIDTRDEPDAPPEDGQVRTGWMRFARGRRGQGHTAVPQDDEDEHELLDAQGFGLGPMAYDAGEAPGAEHRRQRGLWG
ncbi:hypothetical protein B9479_002793 [Cryptococcus floricola]|uniref:Metal homeostatis protein bsd2 n=1 Tax=Cryptococcus floricola TaxID=2591691 RepID=A0A5D3B2V0_9TREE|nr:hypothetical protein B9479_002793 [Cryptococcus floricola]